MNKKFLFHFPNDIKELMRLAARIRELDEYRSLTPRTCYILDLALEEMATNIIKYGYDEPGMHIIEIEIEFSPRMLTLTLIDDGHAFDPLEAPSPDEEATEEEREVGGVGIYLIRNMVRSMRYRREGNHNILVITIDNEG